MAQFQANQVQSRDTSVVELAEPSFLGEQT